jgi:hypothetical protein
MRTRLALAAALLAALCSFSASAAMAWRAPTHRERRAITRVARGSSHAFPRKRVHVSRIHVSTLGPWATALIAIYFNHEPDDAIDVLHKVGHRWRLTRHSPGTFHEACGIGMPHRVQRDLELEVC